MNQLKNVSGIAMLLGYPASIKGDLYNQALLIKDGTLKKGDIVVSGSSVCKVRSLEDFMFKQIDEGCR